MSFSVVYPPDGFSDNSERPVVPLTYTRRAARVGVPPCDQ